MNQLGRSEDGIELLRRAVVIAERLEDPEVLFRARFNLFGALLSAGRRYEAIDVSWASVDIAVRLGCMASYGRDFQSNVLGALVEIGHLSEATALSGKMQPAHDGVPGIRFHLAAARLASAVGDLVSAEGAIAASLAIAVEGTDSTAEIWVLVHAAEVSLAVGRIGEARQRVDEARQFVGESGLSFDGLDVATLAVHIEAEAARQGDVAASDRAGLLLAEAHRFAAACAADGGAIPPDAAAWLALAKAEAGSAQGNPDPDDWADAIHELDRVGRVLKAARARLHHAEAVLASHGSRHDAARSVAEARATAELAGATPLLEKADRLVTRARLDRGPGRQPQPAVPRPGDRYGLTARETEVLAHLADGRTNRQIADALFISEKTASVHVSNLLRKLGVTNRIEAGGIGQALELR